MSAATADEKKHQGHRRREDQAGKTAAAAAQAADDRAAEEKDRKAKDKKSTSADQKDKGKHKKGKAEGKGSGKEKKSEAKDGKAKDREKKGKKSGKAAGRTTTLPAPDLPAVDTAAPAAVERVPGGQGAGAAVPTPTGRSAEQIGRTERGPRPVPELAGGATFLPLDHQRRRLDNGLDVLAVRKPGTPLVEVRLRIPFGGRAPSHAARAELLAATLLLGTARRSREQVDADLAAVGGHLDASVDPARLAVTGSVLSPGLPVVLEVLADSLTGPAFTRRDVAGERDRLVEHLAVAAAQPSAVARQALQEHRFGAHPAAWEMPDAELVAGVTPTALRGMLGRAVVPDGSLLVLVGDLDPAATLDEVAQALESWSGRGRATPLSTPPQVRPGPVAVVSRAGAVQSQIRLTAPAVGRTHPEYAAHQLANLVYGGYFSSRLVENLREDKGLTYSAHSSFEFWPGRAVLTVAFDTASPATAQALLEARYELGRLSLTPPTPAEVDAARNYATGTLATSLASQSGLASTLASLVGQGLDVEWVTEHPARLAAAGTDEVAAAARTLLAPAAFTGVVVGDLDGIGPGLLAVGDVQLP